LPIAWRPVRCRPLEGTVRIMTTECPQPAGLPDLGAGAPRPGAEGLPRLVPGLVASGLVAAAKSQEILARGSSVLIAALAGLLMTSIDDGMAVRRTRETCRTLGSLIACDLELAPRLLSETVARLAVLVRMAAHLCEEAAFPLQAQVERSLAEFFPARHP